MSSSKAGLILKFNKEAIKERWLELQKIPNVFAYTLNVRNQKIIPGNYKFYTEYNPERSSLRRAPQMITSLDPQYNDARFNFNKVDRMEHITSIPFNGTEMTFIINKSPLTKYHTLICPDLAGCLGQRVTLESLRFCVAFLLDLNEKGFRIGYNSPGALASVNHLHYHLVHIDMDLYIDDAKLQPLAKNYIYRLHKDMPTEGVCWLINRNDSEDDFNTKLDEVYDFLMWLCSEDRPHNIFMTTIGEGDSVDEIKLFIFAREKHCIIKDLMNFNVGFCEISGYIPLGNLEIYQNLTEESIITRIRDETGCVYDEVYKFFENWTPNQ